MCDAERNAQAKDRKTQNQKMVSLWGENLYGNYHSFYSLYIIYRQRITTLSAKLIMHCCIQRHSIPMDATGRLSDTYPSVELELTLKLSVSQKKISSTVSINHLGKTPRWLHHSQLDSKWQNQLKSPIPSRDTPHQQNNLSLQHLTHFEMC